MSNSAITALPLGKADRAEFVECANRSFEKVLERIEPLNIEATRKLWDAEAYVRTVLKPDMLPIERDYALHLVEVFCVHYAVDLAVQADTNATN